MLIADIYGRMSAFSEWMPMLIHAYGRDSAFSEWVPMLVADEQRRMCGCARAIS